ncbi:hypothetical protein WISP_78576 [Willisornis vidua]|uniref:Reverse transcriptase domain-containing protein n=1 Tax=Willisornis vidua TaxID=1566151 RepID=A0ABQ9D5V2_9PASS|nr:hypothetical protein WISP_78576 [Willisornis vidua]
MANMVSIFKKGKKKDPRNYRPVSLTSVPGKVVEKFILEGIEKHLKDNAVSGHSQHNFMRGKSCLSNSISFYNKFGLFYLKTYQSTVRLTFIVKTSIELWSMKTEGRFGKNDE